MITSATDLRDIDGNRRAREQLVEWMKAGKCIGFIGAGASAALYGVWKDLIDFLVDEVTNRGLATVDDAEFWRQSAAQRPQQVMRAVKKALGDSRIYEALLKQYFRPKKDASTGRLYTELHEAIVAQPFKGIVTTNYDPALVEALRACRGDVGEHTCTTWKDQAGLNAWHSGDAFGAGTCPLLYAHGIWERPETIILDTELYRQAYADSTFRKAFEYLWTAAHLVIIGVSFTDSWIERLLDDALTHMVHGADIRHVAIIGLREENRRSVGRLRELMQSAYNAHVLFYPISRRTENGVTIEDHGALIALLRSIAAECTAVDASVISGAVEQAPKLSLHLRDYE